jgi:hypothetical protein
MNTITLKTETETTITFTFIVDSTTYEFIVINEPHNYYFATRFAENGYGSDCADYDSIDDIADAFGQPIADLISTELTRRSLPLETSVDHAYFAQRAAEYIKTRNNN